MAWHTSTRRQRLPPNWATLRTLVLTRDRHTCQAANHVPSCTRVATDVDHITPGDNHHPTNLQALSRPCHDAKTAAEAAARNRGRAASRTRTEHHPGSTT